jgi:hypothetical protein
MTTTSIDQGSCLNSCVAPFETSIARATFTNSRDVCRPDVRLLMSSEISRCMASVCTDGYAGVAAADYIYSTFCDNYASGVTWPTTTASSTATGVNSGSSGTGVPYSVRNTNSLTGEILISESSTRQPADDVFGVGQHRPLPPFTLLIPPPLHLSNPPVSVPTRQPRRSLARAPVARVFPARLPVAIEEA